MAFGDDFVTDELPPHPMFNGVPILIGDTITYGNVDDDGNPVEGTLSIGTVYAQRVVNETVWIHVAAGADQYRSDVHERNEVIYTARQPEGSGRVVTAHSPKGAQHG